MSSREFDQWIFGSGKSHLAKMLRTLWTNQTLNNGSDARSIADLPESIAKQLDELSTLAEVNGGLYAASGTLGAGTADKVRLALLGIIFKSAGLPEQYHLARFIMWLKFNGVFDQVKEFVESRSKAKDGVDSWVKELKTYMFHQFCMKLYYSQSPEWARILKRSEKCFVHSTRLSMMSPMTKWYQQLSMPSLKTVSCH